MLLVHCASESNMPDSEPSYCKPWQDVEVCRLIADRKGCRDRVRRFHLCTFILKMFRCAKRRYCTNRLKNIRNSPTSPSRDQQCSPDSFAELLESIYASSADCPSPCKEVIRQLPRISLVEFNMAFTQMLSNRCADCFGISIEMTKFGNSRLRIIDCAFMGQ